MHLRDRLLRRTSPAGGSAIYIFAIDCSARARSTWRDPPRAGRARRRSHREFVFGGNLAPPSIERTRARESLVGGGGAQRLVSSARPTHHPTEDPILPPRS